MKTVEVTGYIYFCQHDWDPDGKFVISQYPQNIGEDEDRKFIREQVFSIEVPDHVDMTGQKLKALQEEKKRIEAEFGARVTQINRKINELLAIENQT
jgi:hypothetical protein